MPFLFDADKPRRNLQTLWVVCPIFRSSFTGADDHFRNWRRDGARWFVMAPGAVEALREVLENSGSEIAARWANATEEIPEFTSQQAFHENGIRGSKTERILAVMRAEDISDTVRPDVVIQRITGIVNGLHNLKAGQTLTFFYARI